MLKIGFFSVTNCVLAWIKISVLITEKLFSIAGWLTWVNLVSPGTGNIISIRILHQEIEVSSGKLLEKELNFSFIGTITGLELV